MGARSGFASGLMGGLIGAGIGGLLFGHGFMGGGGLGFGGFLGFLLQIGLVVLAVSLLVRWFRRRQASPALAGGPNIFARGGAPEPGMMGGSAGPAATAADPDRRAGLSGVRAAPEERPGQLEPA